MAASLPASWVLADLFDVAAHSLVPDYVFEADPRLELVPCPNCGGEGWLECYGSAWATSCELWGRPDLNLTFKVCTRCQGEGEVLTLPERRLKLTLANDEALAAYLLAA